MKIAMAGTGYVELSNAMLLPLQPGGVPDTYADVDDLVREFDYKPNMSVKEGVERFAEWYREFHRIDRK